MDFALNEDQEMFRTYLRKYLEKVGQTKVARAYIKHDMKQLHETMNGLAELGATAINISEENDGLGLGSVDLVPVFEEMGRVLLPGTYLETTAFAVPLIEKYGSKEQKEKYLPAIATGDKTFSLAWLEPGKDYDISQIACSCEEAGDSFIVNGEKELVPDGHLADVLIVLVRNQNGEIMLLLVDNEERLPKSLQKCVDESKQLTSISFQDYTVPKANQLSVSSEAEKILEEGLLHINAGISSLLVGSMEKVVEMATEYAAMREQFGQQIGRFQAIKHVIVDMKMDLEMARSLSYYAGWTLGEATTSEQQAAIYSARAFATEACIRIASQNIQIHGGVGFTEEFDCHLFLKRARFYEHYLGGVNDYHEKIALALGWKQAESKDKVVTG